MSWIYHPILSTSPETTFPLGLPFEGCFRPDGFDVVYGDLSRDEKNRISHRGKALMDLRRYLLKQGEELPEA